MSRMCILVVCCAMRVPHPEPQAQAEERNAADEAARRQRIRDTLTAMDTSNKAQLRAKAEAKVRVLETYRIHMRNHMGGVSCACML